MAGLLDTKLDARFVELLEEHDTVDEAIAEWLGLSPGEVKAVTDTAVLDMMKEYTGTSIDVDIANALKAIKPDPTLRDFVLLKFLVAKAITQEHFDGAFGQDVDEPAGQSEGGRKGAGWISKALKPDGGEMLVILMDDEGNVGALKAKPELIMSVFGTLTMALQAKAMAEQLAGAGEDILAMLKGLEGGEALNPDVIIRPEDGADAIQKAIDSLARLGDGGDSGGVNDEGEEDTPGDGDENA